jgi:hypothetical protein
MDEPPLQGKTAAELFRLAFQMTEEQLRRQFGCVRQAKQEPSSQVTLKGERCGFTLYYRVLAFQGWDAAWTRNDSVALSSMYEVEEMELAPTLTVVLLASKITVTATNAGIEARRCRVVPLDAREVVRLYPLRPISFPCRVERAVAAQILHCELEEVGDCCLLLATDLPVRFLVLGATVGDLVVFGPHKDVRLLTRAPLPEIACVREP